MTAKPGDVYRSPCGAIELRCGDWRDVLADVERVDAVITDPPYSERTHAGQVTHGRDLCERRDICYAAWDDAEIATCLRWWSPRAGWVVALTDHVLASRWERFAASLGRCTFPPLPWFAPGSRVRLQGDGPSCWTAWVCVSRPRSEPWSKWGTLPGGYVYTQDRGGHIGGKPIALMQAIVRDYSRPGDLVCDPCAGGGTTLLAAAIEGRRAIGAELDPVTFEKAVKRLSRGYTPNMFAEVGQ